MQPRSRCGLAAVVLVASLVPTGTTLAPCWRPPVDAVVSDPYREPACRWCPGNRGLEYATRRGQRVTAVETGRVSYAGTIAGVTYVVVEHRDGRRATYGRLLDRRHGRGDLVLRGQVVGSAGADFHFGLRDGDRYIDPTPLIGRWVTRPRLLPTDGAQPAPAPAPILRCAP